MDGSKEMERPSKMSFQLVGLRGVTTSWPQPQEHLWATSEGNGDVKDAVLKLVKKIPARGIGSSDHGPTGTQDRLLR